MHALVTLGKYLGLYVTDSSQLISVYISYHRASVPSAIYQSLHLINYSWLEFDSYSNQAYTYRTNQLSDVEFLYNSFI